jgi:hypothetical protein
MAGIVFLGQLNFNLTFCCGESIFHSLISDKCWTHADEEKSEHGHHDHHHSDSDNDVHDTQHACYKLTAYIFNDDSKDIGSDQFNHYQILSITDTYWSYLGASQIQSDRTLISLVGQTPLSVRDSSQRWII